MNLFSHLCCDRLNDTAIVPSHLLQVPVMYSAILGILNQTLYSVHKS